MESVKEKNEELTSQLIKKIKLLSQNQQEKIISLVDTFLDEKQEYEERISHLKIEKVKKENGGKLYKEQLSYSVEDIQEIINLFPPNKKWTAEDLDDETIFPLDLFVKIELFNYKLFIMALPTPNHQEILTKVSTYMNMFVMQNKLGKLFVAPVAVHIDEGHSLQPDIVLVLNHNVEKITEKGIYEAPDLVIEVISPANYKKLREEKKEKYAGFGVREYWEIYPKKRKINVEILTEINAENKNPSYQLFSTAAKTGKIKSKVLEGFELDIENIF
ncbi:Uma2 family endonuclease [Bernardetia sp. OM2101]|uniref:Uma2 family endonuclease n=1 Tax=Bernardetia sp. OM2101 TaxID=3344876 RepID=UPI0035D0E3E5